MKSDATEGSKSDATDSATSRTLGDRILSFLAVCDVPHSPKIIALRLNARHGSVKTELGRLKRKGLVSNDGTGYIHVRVAAEARGYGLELLRKYEEGTLPRIHDIHLIFKTESFGKSEESSKRIPSLSLPCLDDHQKKILASTFGVATPNTLDPYHFYQIWKGNRIEDTKGGFQEVITSPEYRLTIQLYGTGTIKINVANSERPWDARRFRDFLGELNGIFLARTGVPFDAVQHLFYFEMVHFNRDNRSESVEGLSKLNITSQMMDDWLFRVYEKIIDGQPIMREERALTRGNYQEHNLPAMLALMEGGLNPSMLAASVFAQKETIDKMHTDLTETMRTLKAHDRILEGIVKHLNGGTL